MRSPNSLKPTPSRVSTGNCSRRKLRVARREFDGFRQQQSLRRRLVVSFQPVEHLLEQNPLVRRVLVQQHQAAVGFEHDVELADHADQAQRDVEQGGTGSDGRVAMGEWLMGDEQAGRGAGAWCVSPS